MPQTLEERKALFGDATSGDARRFRDDHQLDTKGLKEIMTAHYIAIDESTNLRAQLSGRPRQSNQAGVTRLNKSPANVCAQVTTDWREMRQWLMAGVVGGNVGGRSARAPYCRLPVFIYWQTINVCLTTI